MAFNLGLGTNLGSLLYGNPILGGGAVAYTAYALIPDDPDGSWLGSPAVADSTVTQRTLIATIKVPDPDQMIIDNLGQSTPNGIHISSDPTSGLRVGALHAGTSPPSSSSHTFACSTGDLVTVAVTYSRPGGAGTATSVLTFQGADGTVTTETLTLSAAAATGTMHIGSRTSGGATKLTSGEIHRIAMFDSIATNPDLTDADTRALFTTPGASGSGGNLIVDPTALHAAWGTPIFDTAGKTAAEVNAGDVGQAGTAWTKYGDPFNEEEIDGAGGAAPDFEFSESGGVITSDVDGTFSLEVVTPTHIAGTYSDISVADDITGGPPYMIGSPSTSGGASVGDDYTALSAGYLYDEDGGPVTVSYEWFLAGVFSVDTTDTHERTANDDTYGLTLTQTAINFYGASTVTSTITAIPAFSETEVTSSSAKLNSSGAINTGTVTQGLIYARFRIASAGNVLVSADSDVGIDIRTNSPGTSLRIASMTSSGSISTFTIDSDLAIGDEVDVLVSSENVGASGFKVAVRQDDGTWLTDTNSQSSNLWVGNIYIGYDQNSGSDYHDDTISRLAIWHGVSPDVTSAEVQALFVDGSGGMVSPDISEIEYGQPLVDLHGTAANWNAATHTGSITLTLASGTFS